MPDATLVHHPATPCPLAARLAVHLAPEPDGGLILNYVLDGDLPELVIPPPAAPGRKDELWRHTCFELFVRPDNGPAYREFNFSPSGTWAAYDFDGYRSGMRPAPTPAPAIACRVEGGALALEAHLSGAALPAGIRLHLALSAVIEDRHGQLSYWALRHPAEKPDFHHTGGFTLSIDRA